MWRMYFFISASSELLKQILHIYTTLEKQLGGICVYIHY